MQYLLSKINVTKINREKFYYNFAIILIVIFSFVLRLIGINWDSGFLFHPDERAILMHGYDLSFQSLKSLDFFNSDTSTLNPRWFNYGSLPLYFVKLIHILSNIFTNTSIYDLRIPLRIVSALIDSVTVILIYRFSLIFFNKKWSLLVAFIYSVSLINIQNSHFFTTDIFITNFTLLIIYFSCKNTIESSNFRSFILGIIFAMGLAFKFSFIMLIIPIIISFFLSQKSNQYSFLYTFKFLAIFFVTSIFSLFVFQPYMFLDFSTYFSHINEQSKMVRGLLDFPYTRQYYETTSFVYPLVQIFKWGLGPVLSIFAFLGLIYFLIFSIRNKLLLGIVIFSWFIPYFFINASFQVKFTRYFLPLIPLFIFFSVFFLKLLNEKISSKFKYFRKTNLVFLLLFLIPTLHFSFSYINGIYLNEHPAYTTSNWLSQKATPEDQIIQDHWEESIPRIPGLNLSHERLELYNPDTNEKFDKIFNQLSESEYYVIFSNRLYATIPRMPDRYPATSLFYEKLFNGSFGYEIVNYEKQSMNLFGINYAENYFQRINIDKPEFISEHEENFLINIDLGWSDESFSVYDHPNVIVLQNKAKFSKNELIEILHFNQYDSIDYSNFSNNFPYKTFDVNNSEEKKYLFSDQYFLNGKSIAIQILFWLFIVNFLGLISIPVFYKLFVNFPDFGYGFYKFFGLILFGFIIWLLSSNKIIEFMFFEMTILLMFFTLLSILIFIYKQKEILFYISKAKYKICVVEGIFLLSFIAFLLIRMLNPDLWHPYRGGEKPMDFAYLNAILRSTSFPPYDPWFSGYSLNYYYYGQYLVALLTKLSGIPANISYNLAIPTFFSYASILTFSFTSNLSHLFRKAKGLSFDWNKIPLFSGLSAIFFVLLFGNFDSIIQISNILLGKQDIFDYWRSTRIISSVSTGLEINEFPFFTFLFADLHAHLLSIPMIISIILISFLLYYENSSGTIRMKDLMILLFLSLLTGTIKATNSWDYPLAILIVLSSIIMLNYFSLGSYRFKLIKTIFYFLFYFIFSKILFFNFDDSFIMPEFALTFSNWKTPFLSMIQILFLPITLLLTFAFLYVNNFRNKFKSLYPQFSITLNKQFIMFFIFLIIGIILGIFHQFLTIFLFLIAILIVTTITFIKSKFFENDSKLFLWISLLLCIGFAIPIFTELFVVKNDINRMNTFFKFNFQSWILLNLASSLLLPFIIYEINNKIQKYIFIFIIVFLTTIGMSYSIYSIKPRVLDRFDNQNYSLDGIGYMSNNKYSQKGNMISLSDSYNALKWINNNIEGNPVIVEHSTDLYSWSSRISINSGLPSVLGWDWHQKQQRSLDSNSVILRKKQIKEFYSTGSSEYIEDFLDFYNVGIIIFGNVEFQDFPDFDKRFESMDLKGINKIYDKNNYKIYEYNAIN
ncbi:MAG: DUF2298 domain-containing protein [Chloroflexota bacterium]|nr:DUF2298 domain-containing protein [Chloroflexota bacterium]